MQPVQVNIYTNNLQTSKTAVSANATISVTINWQAANGKHYTHTETADLQEVLKSLTTDELKRVAEQILVERVREKALAQEKPTPIQEERK